MSDSVEVLLKKSDKVSELCRLCLSARPREAGEAVSLFSCKESVERVLLCTGVKMEDDPSLPGVICAPCSRELDAATCFRLKCQHSDRLLREYFLNFIIKAEEGEDYMTSWDGGRGDNNKPTVITVTGGGVLPQDNIKTNKLDETEDHPINIKGEDIKQVLSRENITQIFICEVDNKLSKKKHPLEYNIPIKEEIDHDYDDRLSDGAAGHESDSQKNSKKYLCPICSKPLSSKSSIEKHVQHMHSEGRQRPSIKGFHCTECPYSTPNSYAFTCHLRVHSGEKPYRCPDCGRCYTQLGSLNHHRRTHSDKMYFTCPQCGKQFKHKEVFEVHKSVHSDLRQFICNICTKGLKSRDTLIAHMNRHNNIRNFNCEACGSTFVTRVDLLNHTKNHNPEKKFKCTLCDFKTHCKKNLVSHALRHSGERAFSCSVCEHACYSRGELASHMRKHTKEKKFSCPVCGLHFMNSSSVNRHMLKVHKVKYRRCDTLDRRIIK